MASQSTMMMGMGMPISQSTIERILAAFLQLFFPNKTAVMDRSSARAEDSSVHVRSYLNAVYVEHRKLPVFQGWRRWNGPPITTFAGGDSA